MDRTEIPITTFLSRKGAITTFLSRKRAIVTFLSRKFMITCSSIAFEDFLGLSIAPQVMPPWSNVTLTMSTYWLYIYQSLVYSYTLVPKYGDRFVHRLLSTTIQLCWNIQRLFLECEYFLILAIKEWWPLLRGGVHHDSTLSEHHKWPLSNCPNWTNVHILAWYNLRIFSDPIKEWWPVCPPPLHGDPTLSEHHKRPVEARLPRRPQTIMWDRSNRRRF